MPEYWDGNINWATIEDVKQKYLIETRRKITQEGCAFAGPLLPENTVLYSSRATIGEISIARVPTTTNQGFKNLIAHPDELDFNYLYHILKLDTDTIRASCAGMTYPEISAGRIADWEIALPPLGIQSLIARKLDKVDCLHVARTTRIKDMAARILDLIATRSSVVPLDRLCSVVQSKIEPEQFQAGQVNYIGLENISEATGELLWSGPVNGVTIKSTKNAFSRGDVLYGKLRPYLNKVWLAEFGGVCSTDIVVLRPRIQPVLLKYLLLSPSFVEHAMGNITGLHLPRINSTALLRILVPDVRQEAVHLADTIHDSELRMARERQRIDRLNAIREATIQRWLD